jgi:hypothetical protein
MSSRLRLLSHLFVIVLAGWLAGCAASTPPEPEPGVQKTREARWAVLPLAVQDTTVDGFERVSLHADAAAAVPRMLRDAGQAVRVVGDPREGDTVQVTDVYRRADRSETAFDLTPRVAAFDSVQAVSGCRYVLTLHAVRWSKTREQVWGERSISALSAMAGIASGRDELFVLPRTPSDETILSLALVDVRRRTVVARRTVASAVADADLVLHSGITWLLTGRYLSPPSFAAATDGDVIVHRYGQPDLVGTGFSIDGREAVVEMKDGTTRRLPVHTVTKVKSTTQNRTIFPAER